MLYVYDTLEVEHLGALQRPYADWFNSAAIQRGHIPLQDGRLLAHTVTIPVLAETVSERSSRALAGRMVELDVQFAPWSSGRCLLGEHACLCFYFSEKSDAAIFRLLWD